MIDGSDAIVIGLLNLDLGHVAKPELHPAYAIFVHLKDGAVGAQLLGLLRPQLGDEELCSDNDHPLDTPNNVIRVKKIPGVAGLVSDNVSEGARNEDNLAPMSVAMQPSGDGVLMTFGLLAPDKESWFVGDLTFVARPPKSSVIDPRRRRHQVAEPQPRVISKRASPRAARPRSEGPASCPPNLPEGAPAASRCPDPATESATGQGAGSLRACPIRRKAVNQPPACHTRPDSSGFSSESAPLA